MNASLGKNVSVSLPKAYQIAKQINKCLVVKGVPTDITDEDFKEFLDLNKISYAKAERYKSKKDGSVLPMFQLEISDPAKAEALLSQNLMCNVTGIVHKVEEFRQPVSVRQCFNCQCFGHSTQNCKSKQKCVICGENHSHKGCPKKEAKQPKCANCSGPHVACYKGCPEYKKQAFRQHVVNHQKSYAAVVSQNSHLHAAQKHTNFPVYSRTANQICSQCGHSNCKATGMLPQSIDSLSAPAPPRPFTFTRTKVNSGSKTISKPSTSKSTSPPKTSTKAVPKLPKFTS